MSGSTLNPTPPNELHELNPPVIAQTVVGNCVLCGEGDLQPYASGYDYELRTCLNDWHFKQCSNCNHIQLDPRPAIEELNIIYPVNYYSYEMSEKLSTVAVMGKALLDRLKFRQILRFLDNDPSSYLDIGCGDGRYLYLIERSQGVPRSKIYGLELSEDTSSKLRDEGFEVFCERVEACNSIPLGTISLATMFHVIEHVADPRTVVAKISSWLAPGGTLAVETPNLDALDARLFKKTYWGGYHIPRHWHLFHRKTLEKLMRDHGIEPVHVAYQTGHSFWMYSLHHIVRYKLRMPFLSKFFDPMKGLVFLIVFTGLDKLRAAIGLKTSSILVVGRKVREL
jgi:SAM-dependent methyltransferase